MNGLILAFAALLGAVVPLYAGEADLIIPNLDDISRYNLTLGLFLPINNDAITTTSIDYCQSILVDLDRGMIAGYVQTTQYDPTDALPI